MELIPIGEWFSGLEMEHVLIAGPCSVESREQALAAARALEKVPEVQVFRGGLWKPRTRPGSFDGVGAEGLPWLKEVQETTRLKVITEVATAEHVEACLHAGIDGIWIGARTTSNPFSVQDISVALRGTKLPVLVKNPIHPELELWIGALERFYEAGCRKLAAIHRGFYPFENTNLRNLPKWELPIELRRRYPELPIICDPSHITGKAALVPDMAQRALNLNLNGLMIEVHPDPEMALSDREQQLTPEAFASMMKKLVFPHAGSSNTEFTSLLEALRNQIDSIDSQVFDLLRQRMDIVSDIGEYKWQNQVTIFQLKRWMEVLESRTAWGEALGLDDNFLQKMLKLIHEESLRLQNEVMKGHLSNGLKEKD